MNNILINNYKLILGILIGIFISIGFQSVTLIFIHLQLIIYFLVVLYFTSFTLLELYIFANTEMLILKTLEVKTTKNERSLSIIMSNENLLIGEELFQGIFNTLMNNENFINFGFQKIIILSCILEDYKEVNLHSNILIDNESTFTDYYNEISSELSGNNNLEYGYNNKNILRFKVKAWNCSNLTNCNISYKHNALGLTTSKDRYLKHKASVKSWMSTQKSEYSTLSPSAKSKHWSKGLITPLSLFNKKGSLILDTPAPIFTMDLETMNINNKQIPVAISSCGFNKGKDEAKLFLIDQSLIHINIDLAVSNLWKQYFIYLESLDINLITGLRKITIFAHNLGDFDGYFLYKALMNYYSPENISSIVDESN